MNRFSYNIISNSDKKLTTQKELNSYIALGFFDGVHLGHQSLLKLCLEKAKKDNAISTVVLLDPHPEVVIYKKNNFTLLSTLPERIEQIKNIGIERIIILKFSEELKNIDGEYFVKEILLNKFNMSAVFVGYDYHFGHKKNGNVDLIKILSEKYNFDYYVLGPINIDNNQIISSTIIKELIKTGDIEKANQYLGYPYQLNGNVIHGYRRGTNILSYPTANMDVAPEKLLPQNGVYITYIDIKGDRYQGLVNIGVKPTFQNKTHDNDNISIEVHIFNFNRNIYNEKISLSLLKKVRDELKFNDHKSLMLQIRRDIIDAEKYFNDHITHSFKETIFDAL